MTKSDERHILALSGGKDSAALAVYLTRVKPVPNLEFVFCDTGHELPETYEYLQKIEAVLGIKIKSISSDRTFEDWLKYKNNFLPSKDRRWCTVELKIRPFEKYIGKDVAYSYIGLRADEDRQGYFSNKINIKPQYPFIMDGLEYSDIQHLLESSGLDFPEYYKWRSRSGCYFCFFQQKIEWLNLYKYHNNLFLQAMSFEKADEVTVERFTWCDDMSLNELIAKKEQIRANHKKKVQLEKIKLKRSNKLSDTFSNYAFDNQGCLICTL